MTPTTRAAVRERARTGPRAGAIALALAMAACRTPDPQALLQTSGVDAYWAVEPTMAGEKYIAPVARFHVRNSGDQPLTSVQAMATFRRVGEEHLTWGSAFEQVVTRKEPLAPGESLLVTLKSDARYHSAGSLEGMLAHEQFRDALVEYFLRVGSSGWVSFGKAQVDRRIGARGVAQEGPVPSAPALPSPPASLASP